MPCLRVSFAILAIVAVESARSPHCYGSMSFAPESNAQDRATAPEAGETSLVTATAQFNRETADARRTLFDPPIPDLTVDELRDGLRQTEAVLRKAKRDTLADRLKQILVDDRLPKGVIFGASGTTAKDAEGEIATRQIVPALRMPESNGDRLVPLSSLNLLYRKGGPSSITYGPILRQRKLSP